MIPKLYLLQVSTVYLALWLSFVRLFEAIQIRSKVVSSKVVKGEEIPSQKNSVINQFFIISNDRNTGRPATYKYARLGWDDYLMLFALVGLSVYCSARNSALL